MLNVFYQYHFYLVPRKIHRILQSVLFGLIPLLFIDVRHQFFLVFFTDIQVFGIVTHDTIITKIFRFHDYMKSEHFPKYFNSVNHFRPIDD